MSTKRVDQPGSPDFSGACLSRNNAIGETSALAAEAASRKAPTMRLAVFNVVESAGKPVTAEDITRALVGRNIVPEDRYQAAVPSVRPRCSELARKGLIRDSGQRGTGLLGCGSVAWELTPIDEREAEAAKYRKPSVDEKAAWTEAFKEAADILDGGARPIEALAKAIFDRMAASGGVK